MSLAGERRPAEATAAPGLVLRLRHARRDLQLAGLHLRLERRDLLHDRLRDLRADLPEPDGALGRAVVDVDPSLDRTRLDVPDREERGHVDVLDRRGENLRPERRLVEVEAD